MLANAVGTAKFCLFMDKTFDSVNARTINPELGKPLRSAVTNKSPHIDHWKYAIKVFESMKFVNKTNGKSTIPPCIKNWIISLKSFLYLWIQLKKHNFKYFLPRQVNHDSLECFFGSVRSHGVRNINPDAYQFVCSFKTLLINNFTSIKSAGNCEHDDSDGTLDNLKQFIESGTNCSLKEPEENNIINIPMFDLPNTFDVCDFTDMTIGYISGYLARTVLKENKFCRLCKNILISNVKNNNLIRVRDYTTKSLLYPSESFQKIIYQMLYITKYILLNIDNESIGKQLILLFEINIDFTIKCPIHDIKYLIYDKFKNFFLFTYIKHINHILNGLDRSDHSKSTDILKAAAYNYYLKHKTLKRL